MCNYRTVPQWLWGGGAESFQPSLQPQAGNGHVRYDALFIHQQHVKQRGWSWWTQHMKGAAFATPLHPAFVQNTFAEFARFVTETPDAAGSIILFKCQHSEKIC